MAMIGSVIANTRMINWVRIEVRLDGELISSDPMPGMKRDIHINTLGGIRKR